MLKRYPHISKGWEQWSRAELLLLEYESLGILLAGRLGVGSEFCITGELSGDASAVGWRTTLWVAGPTREDLCRSRTHQTCGGLVSAYLSLGPSHLGTPGASPGLCSLSIPLPLPGISLPYDLPPPLTPTYCPATWQTVLSVGPEVISSLKSP